MLKPFETNGFNRAYRNLGHTKVDASPGRRCNNCLLMTAEIRLFTPDTVDWWRSSAIHINTTFVRLNRQMDTAELAGLIVDMAEIMLVIFLFIFFRVKYVLQEKGHEVAWFSLSRRQFGDYRTLQTAIKMEQDEAELARFIFYRRLSFFSWLLLPLACVLLFSGWYVS